MPSEIDLTTLARAAVRLKVPTTDAELPGLITAWSQALADWLGYDVHLREGEQETVPSEGGRRLQLRAGALRRVSSITIRGVEVEPGDYYIESQRQGHIARHSCRWPFTGEWTGGIAPMPLTSHNTGEILVTYDAGWRTPGQVALALEADPASTLTSELPPVLEEALLVALTAWYRRLGQDVDVTSKGIGGANVSWGGERKALPLPVQLLARPYYKSFRRKQS